MRKLIPVSQLDPAQIDSLRERVELDLKRMAMAKLGGNEGDWKCRDLLPWTDLTIVSAGQAGATTDFWGTAALVASTMLVYVNHKLDSDEFIGIYGVALRDTDAASLKLLFQTGAAASTLAALGLEELMSSDIPIAVTPEAIYYPGDSTVYIQIMPDAVGKAVGADGVADHLVLVGLMCTKAGEVISK